MSREILFKGKRVHFAGWALGNVSNTLITKNFGSITTSIKVDELYVIPNTVSQFTGFEKNGVKIFENDVLKSWIEDKQEPEGGFFHHTIVKMINGCWSDCGIGYDYELNDDEPLTLHTVMNDDFEVIGSIFDHPELMKDGKF